MKIKSLEIKEKQYLTDVLPQIPTNIILKKKTTGIGATTLEIDAKRNSIIIEPNIPVIVGKTKKHPKLLGVKEGINADDVIRYLQSTKGYKKIMTTPESFPKVIRAFKQLHINYTNEYMLLFDECDKIIKDNGYRKFVTLPFDEFFNFKNKALVSATPIIPSDPRFKEQGFEILEIVPDYDYKIDIQLVTTNNIVNIFRQILAQCEDKEQICFFINSTDLIDTLIQKFGLMNQSKIFCGDDSAKKLKERGYNNAFGQLQDLSKYNFFTSRFYSAVDIELNTKPYIIIITDLFFAGHTIIDPATEAIQLIGRFRNGYEGVLHVSNYDDKIEIKTEKELQSYLDGCGNVYKKLNQLKETATNKGAKDTLQQAMEKIWFARFVNQDGSRDYFAVDNWFDDEKVKGYYKYPDYLKKAYEDTQYFNVKHDNITLQLSDEDYLKVRNAESKREQRLEIIAQLEKLNGEKGIYQGFSLEDVRSTLREKDHLTVDAVEKLGAEFVRKNLSDAKLRIALIKKRCDDGEESFGILTAVNEIFKEGKRYTKKQIKKVICNIYSSFGDNTPYTAKKILDFFENSKDIYMNGQRGYLLLRKK